MATKSPKKRKPRARLYDTFLKACGEWRDPNPLSAHRPEVGANLDPVALARGVYIKRPLVLAPVTVAVAS